MRAQVTTSGDQRERRLKVRAIRRGLADITPSTSRSQFQSLLFSKLPAEVRFSIFQLLLSQTQDYDRPIDIHSISPLYRPGHTYRTKIHTSILLTCRLVYFEARAMPIRSTTHHFRHLGSTSWLYESDIWLHHMTKQRGADIYHLHDNLVALNRRNFTKFLLPHLHWKQVTWTVCAYLWPPILAAYREIDQLAQTLAGIELPASCQEIDLELETREDAPEFRECLQRQAQLCQRIGLATPDNSAQLAGLKRRDGSVLCFDAKSSRQYTWVGSGQARWGTSALIRDKETVKYSTVRVCWRAKVPRRQYASYDCMNCLDLTNCEDVKGLEEDSLDS